MAKISFSSLVSQQDQPTLGMTLQEIDTSRVFGIYLTVTHYSQEETQEPGGDVLTSSHLQLPQELRFLLSHFCEVKPNNLLSNFLKR